MTNFRILLKTFCKSVNNDEMSRQLLRWNQEEYATPALLPSQPTPSSPVVLVSSVIVPIHVGNFNQEPSQICVIHHCFNFVPLLCVKVPSFILQTKPSEERIWNIYWFKIFSKSANSVIKPSSLRSCFGCLLLFYFYYVQWIPVSQGIRVLIPVNWNFG